MRRKIEVIVLLAVLLAVAAEGCRHESGSGLIEAKSAVYCAPPGNGCLGGGLCLKCSPLDKAVEDRRRLDNLPIADYSIIFIRFLKPEKGFLPNKSGRSPPESSHS
jgi:hypothetical protein